MARHITLAGPVELIDGECALRIPLAAGGSHFVECLRGIARVDDEHIIMSVDDSFGFTVGRIVEITNRRGRFLLRPHTGPSDGEWRVVPHTRSWSVGWGSQRHEFFVEFGRS